MSWLILPLMLSRLPKDQRRKVAEHLLPFAVPGAAGQQLALATITAEREVKRQAQTEQRLVEEAIKAGKIKDPAGLAAFPTLHTAFNNLPASVQAGLFKTVTTP